MFIKNQFNSTARTTHIIHIRLYSHSVCFISMTVAVWYRQMYSAYRRSFSETVSDILTVLKTFQLSLLQVFMLHKTVFWGPLEQRQHELKSIITLKVSQLCIYTFGTITIFICSHAHGHSMEISLVSFLLLALFWSPPTPEGNILWLLNAPHVFQLQSLLSVLPFFAQ